MNGNGENKIRKIIFNEVTFFVAVVGIVWQAVMWVQSPQTKLKTEIQSLRNEFTTEAQLSKQLQNIKDNDLHSLDVNLDNLTGRMSEIERAIVRIETILEERLPISLR